jgi:hypothetical protein
MDHLLLKHAHFTRTILPTRQETSETTVVAKGNEAFHVKTVLRKALACRVETKEPDRSHTNRAKEDGRDREAWNQNATRKNKIVMKSLLRRM